MKMRSTIGKIFLWLFAASLILSDCYRLKQTRGGGQISYDSVTREVDITDIALPEGYVIEVVATGLTFPTGITFDERGRPYVIEAGYSYGEEWAEPKLLRIEPDGETTLIASGEKNGPWNGVEYHDGNFYIAEGGELKGGKILRVTPRGEVTALIDNLPSLGDHHTNGPAIRDGYIYFGQGTATNSAVVGDENADFGWLKRYEKFHDIPCRDVTLMGINYETDNVLTEDPADKAVTGAYSPYNSSTSEGQVIKGQVPCNGAIMRIPLEGGPAELVAWGLRNPFGLAYSPDGRLFVTENGYDDRGSRPVWGTGDMLWEIEPGTWYGWPDFSGQDSLNKRNKEFKPPNKDVPQLVLAHHPNQPPEPSAILGVHSSSNGLDFSDNPSFGYEGKAFIAQFGDMAPGVGKVVSPVGFKVVSVDVSTGVIEDFAVNKGRRNGPATWLEEGGLERPVDVKFDPAGSALYIVDFGIMTTSEEGPNPYQETGVIFKITRRAQ